jgi:hypothetical protein
MASVMARVATETAIMRIFRAREAPGISIASDCVGTVGAVDEFQPASSPSLARCQETSVLPEAKSLITLSNPHPPCG